MSITSWVTVICAVISGVFMLVSYYETSNATMKSSNNMTKANTRNMYVAQYNNLFERNGKLSDEIYQLQQSSLSDHQDEIIFYQMLKKAVGKMEFNHIGVSDETKRFLRNVSRKLEEDSENSL